LQTYHLVQNWLHSGEYTHDTSTHCKYIWCFWDPNHIGSTTDCILEITYK
jgi:hypothetical protein